MGTESRSAFTSRYGFIIASIGSAVGLGNIWRFPYCACKYGGGAFIFAYFVLMVTFGFVLLVTELAVGRKTGKSCLGAYWALCKRHRWIGYVMIAVPMIISSYYFVIGGWILKFFSLFATGSTDVFADETFFSDFCSGNLDGILNSPFLWFLIFALLCFFVCTFRVEKGLERVNKIVMPILLGILVVLAVFVLTLPGIGKGVEYYLVPNFTDGSIGSSTFIAALGQLFYSLSLGQGIVITFGSYAKKDVDFKKSALIVAIGDLFVSILSGLIIVPVVHVFGGSMDVGSGLIFNVLPGIFMKMDSGIIIGALFFLLVAFAAITSAIALIETPVSSLIDCFRIERKKALFMICVPIILWGLVCCSGYGMLSFVKLNGMYILEMTDMVVNIIMIPLMELALCIIVGYSVGVEIMSREIGLDKSKFWSKTYPVMIKYIAPVLIVAILVLGLAQYVDLFEL